MFSKMGQRENMPANKPGYLSLISEICMERHTQINTTCKRNEEESDNNMYSN